jgi:hypothetical protein
MAGRLNKKILCFVDEYGTAGATDLHLSAVLVRAQNAGRVDKILSDLLKENAGELHAVRLDDRYVESLLERFWHAVPERTITLMNRKCPTMGSPPPILYAQGVVETTKAGLKEFKGTVLGRDTVNNVELILDLNQHNSDPLFAAEIERARSGDGRFRAVRHFSTIDSAASRLLQLADLVAYARKWVASGRIKAPAMQERFGIRVI